MSRFARGAGASFAMGGDGLSVAMGGNSGAGLTVTMGGIGGETTSGVVTRAEMTAFISVGLGSGSCTLVGGAAGAGAVTGTLREGDGFVTASVMSGIRGTLSTESTSRGVSNTTISECWAPRGPFDNT